VLGRVVGLCALLGVSVPAFASSPPGASTSGSAKAGLMIRAPNPAGHAGSPGVVIVSLRATPAGGLPLPASGARVRLDVRVRNAARCTFVRQYSAVSSLYPYRTLDCRFGRASVTIPAIANRHRTPVWLTYGVRVWT
jgi:hypothetical protein